MPLLQFGDIIYREVRVPSPSRIRDVMDLTVTITPPDEFEVAEGTPNFGTLTGNIWTIDRLPAGFDGVLSVGFTMKEGVVCPTGRRVDVKIDPVMYEKYLDDNEANNNLDYITCCDLASCGNGQGGGSGEDNVQSDWNELNNTSDAFIKNKPFIFSGSYLDLTNKPALFSGKYGDLTGKPNLSVVATTGDYNDLLNKPDISGGGGGDSHPPVSNTDGSITVDGSQVIGVKLSPDAGNAAALRNNGIYVTDTVGGGGSGTAYGAYRIGKARVFAKATAVDYVISNGTGNLIIDKFGDITHASIIVKKSSDAVSGTFVLKVNFKDDIVNTWDVTSGAVLTAHDLYIPDYRIYDIGATTVSIAQATDKSSDDTTGIFPSEISWANGELSLRFGAGSSYDRVETMLIQLNFPRL